MKTIHKILMLLTSALPAKAIDLNGHHYIERYHVLTLGKLTILLHRYLGADGDRHLHDHPHKWSLGIPLAGGYIEEKLVAMEPSKAHTIERRITPWRWNFIGTLDFHRIARVIPGTWTLFITWNRFKYWGELRSEIAPDRHVDYGVKVVALRYAPMPDTAPTNSDWYKFAKTGKQLRNARGTDF